MENPNPETPKTETPATETPATETPATETPATETPVTETPATGTPAQEPAPEAPKKSNTGKIIAWILAAAIVIFAVLCLTHVICLKHNAPAATCTEPSVCKYCGKELAPALGHTVVDDAAVEPTCTEDGLTAGQHCSVCNEILVAQETVPALGHTVVDDAAVEPTCTEDGLTAGQHCSVCNEILVAQETVPATGHSFADATYTLPRTCTVCGATEGEPLGNGIFEQLFTSALGVDAGTRSAAEEAEAAEPAAEGTEAAAAEGTGTEAAAEMPALFGVKLSAYANGTAVDADTTALLDGIAVEYHYDLTDGMRFEAVATIPGIEEPVRTVTSIVDDGLEFYCPAVGEKVWLITYDALDKSLPGFGSMMKKVLAAKDSGTAALTEAFGGQTADLSKYGDVLKSLFNAQNATDTEGEAELALLGEKVTCRKLTFAPTDADWKNVFVSLAETLKNDDTLAEAFAAAFTSAGQQMDAASVKQMLASVLENADALADSIVPAVSGYTLEIDYAGSRVYKLAVAKDGSGFGIENFGTAETGLKGAAGIYSGSMAMAIASWSVTSNETEGLNATLASDMLPITGTVTAKDGTFALALDVLGYAVTANATTENDTVNFEAAFASTDLNAGFKAAYTAGGEAVTMPEGERTRVENEEQLNAMAQEVVSAIMPVTVETTTADDSAVTVMSDAAEGANVILGGSANQANPAA